MFKHSLTQIINSNTIIKDRARTIFTGTCEWCNDAFWIMRPFRKNRRNRFCSGSHAALFEWKKKLEIGYRGCLDNHGYVRWKIDGRQLRAHRFVIEQALGRKLEPNEWIHHKNGDKSDNRLTNLIIVTHASPHHEIKCPRCKYAFKVH